MKAKKNDDLENELINELLDDKTAKAESSAEGDDFSFSSYAVDEGDEKKISHKDATVRLSESKILPAQFGRDKAPAKPGADGDNSVKVSVGGKFAVRPGSALRGSSEAALVQSENLRVAQEKIFELEQEIERLRVDNEQLAAAGETIRMRFDELLSENESKGSQLAEIRERFGSEKEILENSLKAKDREVREQKMKIEEYEMRLSTNLQKIRVRERELENRLELAKMESIAVLRSKDELILELKRQLDHLNIELENYRTKSHELNHQMSEKQEVLRRTVKALRLALNMLEGTDSNSADIKKAK